MSQRAPRPGTDRWGWAVVGVGALAVTGLVVGVWISTHGSPETGAGSATSPSATAPGIGATGPTAASSAGPASAVDLFPRDDVVPVDTSREVVVDVAGVWPLGGCPAPADEPRRVDFVSGTEDGPEYARDLAMAWYADDASAALAYDSVWATVQDCAAGTGATVTSDPAGLGAASLVATVAQPVVDGETAVSIYALARTGAVITLAIDHATFFGATGPPPSDAGGTRDQAERLVAELCRVEPVRC